MENYHDKQNRIHKSKIDVMEKIENLIVCVQDLKFEITQRYETLKNKCESDLTEISDYEILELKRREDNFRLELHELLDKISSLIQLILPCGTAAAMMRSDVITMRDNILTHGYFS